MVDFNEIQLKFKEEDFELCDKYWYEYYFEQIDENLELKFYFLIEYGVIRSILLDDFYFNIIEQFFQDVMYIVFEGVLLRVLFFVIFYFVNNNIFILKDLNLFVLNFSYGFIEFKDKLDVLIVDDLKNFYENLGQIVV